MSSAKLLERRQVPKRRNGVKTRICASCLERNRKGSLFCEKCGVEIEQGDSQSRSDPKAKPSQLVTKILKSRPIQIVALSVAVGSTLLSVSVTMSSQFPEINGGLPLITVSSSGDQIAGHTVKVTGKVFGKNNPDNPWVLRLERYEKTSDTWKKIASTTKNILDKPVKLPNRESLTLRFSVTENESYAINYSTLTIRTLNLKNELEKIYKALDDSIREEKRFQESGGYDTVGQRFRQYLESIVDPAYYDFSSKGWKEGTDLASSNSGSEPLDYIVETTFKPDSIREASEPVNFSRCLNTKLKPTSGVWFTVDKMDHYIGEHTEYDYWYYTDTFKVSGNRLYMNVGVC